MRRASVPVRIYALAKELKEDSKALVDICAKAGVTGKGSALASLTDEEVDKVKAYLSGGGGGGGSTTANSGSRPLRPPTRPTASTNTTIKTIITRPKADEGRKKEQTPAPLRAAMQEAAMQEAAMQEAAMQEAVGDAPPVSEPPAEEAAPAGPAAAESVGPLAASSAGASLRGPTGGEPGVLTRDNAYTGRSTQKGIRVIGRRSKSGGEDAEDDRKKAADADVSKGPKLAPMPEMKQPAPAAPKAQEPAAQKPTIRLPKDAIQKAKQGSSGRLDQIREQAERKRKKEEGAAGTSDAAKAKPGRRGRGRGEPTEDQSGRGLAGMAGTRKSRQDGRKRRGRRPEDDDMPRRVRRMPRKGPARDTAAPRKERVAVELPCNVRNFSEAAGVPAASILRKLMELGAMATINSVIDFETAENLQLELELDVELREAESLEDSILTKIEEQVDAEEDLVARPPVITFLGHVDHGKTSLLDRVIGTDVVAGEAGGITQHIRAYSISKDGRKISFVDTPGHEAFTEMRARGANVTDIAVLVVAADDGIMPQTEEAISHAKAAEVPIVVAMNKMDLPGAKPDQVLTQLSQHELLPTEWGGDVEVIKTSAITGDGIDDLLETLLLTAEIHDYQANPKRAATGVCLEAEQEPGRGVLAKLIVKNGTLNVGDVVVCGSAHGRVKAMYDTLKKKKKRKNAGPSIPVEVTGLDVAPEAGDTFYVLDDIAQAREIAANREKDRRRMQLSGFNTKISFDEFQRRLAEGALSDGDGPAVLNLIIRADVRGSIEAIMKELDKFEHPEVAVKVLQASVGGVTVGDVTLADASDAVILGFNVIPDEAARAQADERGVEIRRYDVIYRLTGDIKDMLEGKLKPEEQVKDLGRALVKQLFSISRLGTIAGCHVLDGAIQRGCRVRVNREGRTIGDYALDSLRREKDDTKEVRKGYECGMKLTGFNDLKEGDILEAYEIEEVKREL